MSRKTIGIVLNGVTGRMGLRQHLIRSVLAIREEGGLPLTDGDVLWPEPVLVGRSEAKLRALADQHGLTDWTTDLAAALAREDVQIYFDAQVTSARDKALRQAIDAGKHVYTEKPVAETVEAAAELARLADAAGIKHGVVQDKLYLPGLRKLRRLALGGFFGRVLSVRGEFGYWVFEGDWQSAQRPSWNYRTADGGGITLDMFPHWHYVLEQIFGPVRAVTAHATTHIDRRWDENGGEYEATADDAVYGLFELDGGIVAQINSSWAVRVNRDELVEFQVDGTHGSAVAGLHHCRIQPRATTPKPTWDPDVPTTQQFREQWQEVPDNEVFANAFRAQWEQFLRYVAEDAPYSGDLWAGARGVQVAELGLQSSREGRRIEIPDLDRSSPDRSSPDRLSPDRPELDGSSPDRSSLDGSVADRSRRDGFSPDRSSLDDSPADRPEPDGSVVERSEPDGLSLDDSPADRPEPDGSVADRPEPDGFSPDGFSPDRSSLDGSVADRPKRDGSSPDRSSLDGSVADRPEADGSSLDGSVAERSELGR